MVPLRRLERDLVLWREQDGTLHCQDHACRQTLGRLGERWLSRDGFAVCASHPDAFDDCHSYLVVERHGAVFVWSGASPPDHEFPDVVAEHGVDEQSEILYHRFLLPFPTKWFAENEPDMAHFAFVHNAGEWGDCEVIGETDTTLTVTGCVYGKRGMRPRDLVRLYKRDDLADFMEFSGDVTFVIYGSGLALFSVSPPAADAPKFSLTGPIGKVVESVRIFFGLTPVDVGSHVIYLIMFVPRVRLPIGRRPVEWIVEKAIANRNWAAARQDYAVMVHRNEQPGPRYNRLDRALVRHRRFWDRRIPDRTLGAGDNLHANGSRAGIDWQDDLAPAAADAQGRA